LGRVGAPRGLRDALSRSGKVAKLVCGTARPGHKLSPTVWALALKDMLGTSNAECALKGANSRLRRYGGQVLVTALTIWTELKHVVVPLG